MDTLQNLTKSGTSTGVSLQNVNQQKTLTEQQERYVSYKAVNGVMVSVGDGMSKMSMQEFADAVGVTRQTLYDWQKAIPDFWERVKERRLAIGSRDQTTKVWHRVYLDALSGKEPQQRLWLGQFDEWKPPAQAHDVKIGGWADAINSARKRKDDPDVIDADQ